MPKRIIKKNVKKVNFSNAVKTQRASAPRPRAARSVPSGIESPAYKLACSIANPFECTACIPDGANAGCFSTKMNTTLVTVSPAQSVGFALQMDPVDNYASGAGTSSSAFTGNWQATSAQTLSSVQNIFGRYRPVSGGMKLSYVGSTTQDQGVILVGLVSPALSLSFLSGKTQAEVSSLMMEYKLYPLRNGATITWRPNDQEDMDSWKSVKGANSAVSVGSGLPWMLAIVYGCATNASVLQVETISNFEGTYINSSFQPGITTANKVEPQIGWYETTRKIISKVAPIVMGVSDLAARSGIPIVSSVGSLVSSFGRALGASSALPKLLR